MDRREWQNKVFQKPEVWERCCRYIVEILKAVLSEKAVPELPAGMTWEQVYMMSKYHCLESMVFAGVQEMLDKKDPLYRKWELCCAQNLAQCLTQEEEAEEIVQGFAGAEIDMVLLKGYVMRELYPRKDFRQMVDLDILVRESDITAAGKILRRFGYQQAEDPSEPEYHDGYRKRPYMGVELHRSLVAQDSPYYKYCGRIWDLVIPEKGEKCRFQMNVNDYYIFLLIHFAKHLSFWGSGIRSVLDVYIYLQKYEEVMDKKYLEKWMQVLELQNFRRTVETLGEYWFGIFKSKPAECLLDMEIKCFFSGAHGSRRQQVLYQAAKYQGRSSSVLPYIFSRIFMNREGMAVDYPCLKRYPVMLPLCWIHRLGKSVFTKREMILYEIRYFLRIR